MPELLPSDSGAVNVVEELASRPRWSDVVLVGRFVGGESKGAHLVVTPNGERWVLKWSDAPPALRDVQISRIERLRSVGFPIPFHEAIALDHGGSALLQHCIDGDIGAPVTQELASDVTRLVGLQAGLADVEATDWHDLIVGSLTEGLDGWCVHEPLRNYSDRSQALLDRIQAVGRDCARSTLDAADLVHLDLHTENMATRSGRVVGVFDWDAIRPGDRRADLAKFAFTSLDTATDDVLAFLWDPLVGHADRSAAYVAHVVLNLVDWRIRFHPENVDVAIRCGEQAFGWVDAGRFTGFDRPNT